jgi:hypothetical protein
VTARAAVHQGGGTTTAGSGGGGGDGDVEGEASLPAMARRGQAALPSLVVAALQSTAGASALEACVEAACTTAAAAATAAAAKVGGLSLDWGAAEAHLTAQLLALRLSQRAPSTAAADDMGTYICRPVPSPSTAIGNTGGGALGLDESFASTASSRSAGGEGDDEGPAPAGSSTLVAPAGIPGGGLHRAAFAALHACLWVEEEAEQGARTGVWTAAWTRALATGGAPICTDASSGDDSAATVGAARLAGGAQALLYRFAESLPVRFAHFWQAQNRGLGHDMERLVARRLTPLLFAVQVRRLKAAAAGGGSGSAKATRPAAGAAPAGAVSSPAALAEAAARAAAATVSVPPAVATGAGPAAPVAAALQRAQCAFLGVAPPALASATPGPAPGGTAALAAALAAEAVVDPTSGADAGGASAAPSWDPETFAVRALDTTDASTAGGLSASASASASGAVGSGGSREVTATYVHEEARLTIRVALPAAFPLRRAVVTCEQRAGVAEDRWRRWELQIATLLSSRDASLVGALSLWKRNLDKEFEGVEPCPICYSVIALGDRSLPRMACPTCKHAFHSSCLLKWFRSSHESKCPLCRQLFR